jgi:hypothetical protein
LNYYNEWDKKKAAGLQEITSTQVRMGRNAFGQLKHGKLDTKPKPYQAICNSLSFATLQNVHTQACVLHPKHGIHRKIRNLTVRLDLYGETESDWNLVVSWLYAVPCIWPLLGAAYGEMCEQIKRCWHDGIRLSIATCCADLVLSETMFHKSCNYARHCVGLDFYVANAPCRAENKTSGGNANRAFQHHIQHILVAYRCSISYWNFT